MSETDEYPAVSAGAAQGADKEVRLSVRHLRPSEWRRDTYRQGGWVEYVDLSYAGIGLVTLIGSLRDSDTLVGLAPDGHVYLIPYGEDSFQRTSSEKMEGDVLVYEPDKGPASFTRVILDEEN